MAVGGSQLRGPTSGLCSIGARASQATGAACGATAWPLSTAAPKTAHGRCCEASLGGCFRRRTRWCSEGEVTGMQARRGSGRHVAHRVLPAALAPHPQLMLPRPRSGRILAPVVLIDASERPAPDAPAGLPRFVGAEKRCSVVLSDDGGDSWRASAGTAQPGRSWAQWEVGGAPRGRLWEHGVPHVAGARVCDADAHLWVPYPPHPRWTSPALLCSPRWSSRRTGRC